MSVKLPYGLVNYKNEIKQNPQEESKEDIVERSPSNNS